MHQKPKSSGALRAAFTMRELENAKRSSRIQTGTVGVLMRVTLAIIFIYLIGISYMTLGITGPVIVSVLFLVAFFVPFFYQVLLDLLETRRMRRTDRMFGQESVREGRARASLLGDL